LGSSENLSNLNKCKNELKECEKKKLRTESAESAEFEKLNNDFNRENTELEQYRLNSTASDRPPRIWQHDFGTLPGQRGGKRKSKKRSRRKKQKTKKRSKRSKRNKSKKR